MNDTEIHQWPRSLFISVTRLSYSRHFIYLSDMVDNKAAVTRMMENRLVYYIRMKGIQGRFFVPLRPPSPLGCFKNEINSQCLDSEVHR